MNSKFYLWPSGARREPPAATNRALGAHRAHPFALLAARCLHRPISSFGRLHAPCGMRWCVVSLTVRVDRKHGPLSRKHNRKRTRQRERQHGDTARVSKAPRRRGPHGRVCRLFSRGPRGPGRRGPASGAHLSFIRAEILGTRQRPLAAHGAFGGGPGLVWGGQRPCLARVPRRPDANPLGSATSRSHPLLGPSSDLLGTWGAI